MLALRSKIAKFSRFSQVKVIILNTFHETSFTKSLSEVKKFNEKISVCLRVGRLEKLFLQNAMQKVLKYALKCQRPLTIMMDPSHKF
jgi:hypothetical protein